MQTERRGLLALIGGGVATFLLPKQGVAVARALAECGILAATDVAVEYCEALPCLWTGTSRSVAPVRRVLVAAASPGGLHSESALLACAGR
jgi:hypothetical protein